MSATDSIIHLTPEIEKRIWTNPLLNIDTFIIPSPYIRDHSAVQDYDHSYVWIEEGEILGFMQTYVSDNTDEYLIYKLVTSPYGRGQGIGTAFISRLADEIPEKSRIYLYVWEKQHDTVNFFCNKGFKPDDSIVYRNMVYHLLIADRESVKRKMRTDSPRALAADEIGRTRHDARKVVSSILAMVNALAPENAGRIIEEINRETTSLVNMLNMYRDSMELAHEVNLQDLILERLVPYVGASHTEITLSINLSAPKPIVLGHWLNISRALVNLASNAIDSMAECSDRTGCLSIVLENDGDEHIALRIADNGNGISEERLRIGKDGKPLFIGTSTKGQKGEGLGTAQVWGVFGPDRLSIDSRENEGTEWTIRFERSAVGLSRRFASLQRRFHELQGLSEEIDLTHGSSSTNVVTAIWQVRQREIFLYELLERFSQRHNIRDLYRAVLAFLQGAMDENELEQKVASWHGEHPAMNAWLSATARRVRARFDNMAKIVDLDQYQGALFKSYGQILEKVVIFTLNPAIHAFLATDRKLAEHLDFVPYLGGDRTEMLRGEFVGDLKKEGNPIYLGVWSVESEDDLDIKLKLLQDGARTILDFEIPPSKRLAFYQSTYIRHSRDINSDASTTLGEFSRMSMDELRSGFVRETEDEMKGFLAALE